MKEPEKVSSPEAVSSSLYQKETEIEERQYTTTRLVGDDGSTHFITTLAIEPLDISYREEVTPGREVKLNVSLTLNRIVPEMIAQLKEIPYKYLKLRSDRKVFQEWKLKRDGLTK